MKIFPSLWTTLIGTQATSMLDRRGTPKIGLGPKSASIAAVTLEVLRRCVEASLLESLVEPIALLVCSTTVVKASISISPNWYNSLLLTSSAYIGKAKTAILETSDRLSPVSIDHEAVLPAELMIEDEPSILRAAR